MKTNQILALIAVLGGLFAAFTNYSSRNNLYPAWKFEKERIDGQRVELISASHLAELLYKKEQGIVVLDTRSEAEYNSYHIPSSLRYEKGEANPDREKSNFIVIGIDSGDQARELSRALQGKVYLLAGGMKSWKTMVLFPDFSQFRVRNREALEQIIRRSRYFGGNPQNTQLLNIDIRESRYREGC